MMEPPFHMRTLHAPAKVYEKNRGPIHGASLSRPHHSLKLRFGRCTGETSKTEKQGSPAKAT